MTELEQWKKNYYDVADSICRESKDTADLCKQARETREHRNRLQYAVGLLLEASWNGPIDADHPARAKAVAALANIQRSETGEARSL